MYNEGRCAVKRCVRPTTSGSPHSMLMSWYLSGEPLLDMGRMYIVHCTLSSGHCTLYNDIDVPVVKLMVLGTMRCMYSDVW